VTQIKIYQVDAFTDHVFGGNPAAVCPLDEWLNDELMQKIAMENNLAETAFYVRKDDEFELRWFTPKVEVDLCGHATLATAFILFEKENCTHPVLKFHTRSGLLTVARNEKEITMNFPADTLQKIPVTDKIKHGIGLEPFETYLGKNVLMIVLNSEKDLVEINPDPIKLAALHTHGVIITAEGESTDFVSRCFFPNLGVIEDPVTGSAHTILTPYWSARLKKNFLTARQLSERKGDLLCKVVNDRVEISGTARLYLQGVINF
jgi:PhzF family phenazine biosynthesis protein